MVKLLNGVRKNMVTLKKIDNIANLWDQLVKEFANGPNNIERRTVPVNSSVKTDNGKHKIIKQPKLF